MDVGVMTKAKASIKSCLCWLQRKAFETKRNKILEIDR